jgi:hypothetical protein
MDILHKVRDLGISPDDYSYLFLRANNQDTEGYVLDWSSSRLEEKGYIKVLTEGIILREKALDLFFDKGDKFALFWTKYPIKVPNGRGPGYRILKSKGLDTKEAEECRKKFEKLPADKDTVIAALDRELDYRRAGNSLPFMQDVKTWLNQRTYEKYLDDIIVDSATFDYGKDI